MKRILLYLICIPLFVTICFGNDKNLFGSHDIYYRLAEDALNKEDYTSALFWSQKSLEYTKTKYGDNNNPIAYRLSLIGTIQIKLGHLDEGLSNLINSVKCAKHSLLRRDPLLLISLADGYKDCHQNKSAIMTYNRALAVLEDNKKSLFVGSPDLYIFKKACILNAIADCYILTEQYNDGIKFYQLSNNVLKTSSLFLLEDDDTLRDKGTSEFDDLINSLYKINTSLIFETHLSLCKSFLQKKDFNNAIRHYDYAMISTQHCQKSYSFHNIEDELVISLFKDLEKVERARYIEQLTTFRIEQCKFWARCDNKSHNNLLKELYLTYWNIAENICKSLNEIDLGTSYMLKGVNIYKEYNCDSFDYAYAMIDCANWMQHVGNYQLALEYNLQHILILASICNNEAPKLKDAITELCARWSCNRYDAIDSGEDELLHLAYWEDALEVLYNKLGYKYIDSILLEFKKKLDANKKWNYYDYCTPSWTGSNTLYDIMLQRMEILIKQGRLKEADSLILELKGIVNPSQNIELWLDIWLYAASIYRSTHHYTKAKDTLTELLLYLQEDPLLYQKRIEQCETALANLLHVHLKDTDGAIDILYRRYLEHFMDENAVRASYFNIKHYILDQITLSDIAISSYHHERAKKHILNAYNAFNQISGDKSDITKQALLESIGSIYYHSNDYDLAEKYFNQSLEIYNHICENNKYYNVVPIHLYAGLSFLYTNQKKYPQAKEYQLKILHYAQSINDIRLMTATYGNLVGICYEENNYSEMTQFAYKWLEHNKHFINSQFILMTEDERSILWKDQYGFRELFAGMAIKTEPYLNKFLYDLVLFQKGLLLRTHIEIEEFIGSSNNKKLLDIYSQLQKARRINDKQKTFIYQREISDLLTKYVPKDIIMDFTFADIIHRSRENDITIEFTECYKRDPNQLSLAALLLRKDWEAPEFVEICSAEDVTELERIYKSGAIAYKNDHSNLLYNLIWSKLEPYINEGDDVYFAPDGLLYQMNIEVLQDANGKRANEKWNLHRVSSTRELCMEKLDIDINSAALYGGLTYEMDSEAMLSQSRAYNQVSDEAIARGFIPDSTKRAGWQPLPATLTEISSIARMCKSRGMTVDTYTAMTGNEESFKALSGKKTPIIHLATHGFFYKNEEVTQKPFFNAFNFDQMPQKPDNSLKRTGLILAGGQKAWLGEAIPDNVEDGILLAEEIASMDLTGTDLVVLSACETGLGEITSEGVFGLQRAFKKAGVQTLIMSLWKVDDGATSLFMQTFYKHWLDGKSKHEAFTMAQKTMQEHPDYSNPYYWAAFIMLD